MTRPLPARSRPVPGPSGQQGSGLLVPPRSQAPGPGNLPGGYPPLAEAVSAVAAGTGGAVTCAQAAQRAGIDVTGRQSENVRASLKRLEDRGLLRAHLRKTGSR